MRRSGGILLAPSDLAAASEQADFSFVRCEPLRIVSEQVLAQWAHERHDVIDQSDLRAVLLWLVRAVDEAAEGAPPPRNSPAATTLGRHLLEQLRAGLLQAWSEPDAPVSSEAVLGVLRAVESVRLAIEPDWSQYFTSRLSGLDGLDLVVEVAYDLRSPVTSILFLAETLSSGRSGDVNDLQKRQLRLIYSAALGLSSMTSDVIELARGQDQLVETEPSPFHVAAIIDSVLDMVRPIAEEKNLELRVTPPASDYRLGRPLALSRIILNLVTNALKFTDEGYVEVATRPLGLRRVEFSVRDTGRGVSEESLANLYQPFRRTKARTGHSGHFFSGTGLGLAMCRTLVEAMGSELELETRSGWGTRFFFQLDLPVVTQS